MTRSFYFASLMVAIAVSFAACDGSSTVLRPQPPATAVPPASLPFVPLQFNVLTIGQSVTNGWQCPTGIITSPKLLPSSTGVHVLDIHVATGGCDDSGFPIPSPLPTPPAPTPVPLATLSTAQIVAPSFAWHVPPIVGWNAVLAMPACTAGTCDAGTSNGTIALNALPAASSTALAFDLVFRNTGPETPIAPTPSPADRPAPHIYNLYGPPEPPGMPLQPVPVYVSGAPVTIVVPSLTVTLPANSTLSTSSLRLTIVQTLTPPAYEEAIYTNDYLAIPLKTSSPAYAPASTTPTTATFTLPAATFPFQTDFTEYDFAVASP